MSSGRLLPIRPFKSHERDRQTNLRRGHPEPLVTTNHIRGAQVIEPQVIEPPVIEPPAILTPRCKKRSKDNMSESSRSMIRVFLVDDHQIVLHGLSEFFKVTDDIHVVGSATSAQEALETLGALDVDVAVLDVRLSDMDGITLCREIRARHSDVQCLMLSSYGTEDALLEAIVAGAAGYILKELPLPEVADAIRTVAQGGSLLDPQMTARVLDRLRAAPEEDAVEKLTAQERRILDLMAKGLSNREISEQLFLAEQTVKNYVSSILSKLGMQRRTQAAVYATNLRQRDRRKKD